MIARINVPWSIAGWRKHLSESLLALTLLASPATAGQPPLAPKPSIEQNVTAEVAAFHQARGWTPLWLAPSSGDAAQKLLALIETSASADGQGSVRTEMAPLLQAAENAGRSNEHARKAELLFSQAFVTYARSLQIDPKVGVIYVDAQLRPRPWTPRALLDDLAGALSQEKYVDSMGWMHPLYAELRAAIVGGGYADGRQLHLLRLNLERVRALPPVRGRYVLVNTAEQRLQMFEEGNRVDEMKVVVGRNDAQTPMMNAMIRYAVLNPYWKVPSDITARLAPNVVKRGPEYLKEKGYLVVSDFGETYDIIDPATIDWKAVVARKASVQLLQKPGPANSMGRVKYMFPNSQGIWLHDTPSRDLFSKSERLESAGCVRLQDAWKLGAWLMDGKLSRSSTKAEQRVELPTPVPVFITYLTAVPSESKIVFIDDHYRRDLPPQDQVEFTAQGIGIASGRQTEPSRPASAGPTAAVSPRR